MGRQFCCVCLKTTDQPQTVRIDRRTPAEIRAGKPPAIGTFHYCPVHFAELEPSGWHALTTEQQAESLRGGI